MSRLLRFQRKPKELEFKLEDENAKEVIEKLTIIPIKVKDMDVLLDLNDPDKTVGATHKVLKKVLKDNKIDYTEGEYQDMDYEFVDAILNAIMDVSNVDINDAKKKFLADMKAKQEASKTKK